MKKILFVCTGNTCRSPMAEAFFNNIVRNSEILKDEFYAESAGISAYNGIQASENAPCYGRMNGYPADGHVQGALKLTLPQIPIYLL